MVKMHREPSLPFEGEDIHTIDDLETLKVVADPLRLRIIEELRREPKTVKQVAEQLGQIQTKLYYHFRTLEEHDLIRAVDTRIVSGIIEKHYQTTAARLTVDRDLLAPGTAAHADDIDEGLDVLLSVILDEAKTEIRRAVRAGLITLAPEMKDARALVLGRRWMRLSPEQMSEFLDRLLALQDEYEQDDVAPAEGAIAWEFLLGVYPTSRRADDVTVGGISTAERRVAGEDRD